MIPLTKRHIFDRRDCALFYRVPFIVYKRNKSQGLFAMLCLERVTGWKEKPTHQPIPNKFFGFDGDFITPRVKAFVETLNNVALYPSIMVDHLWGNGHLTHTNHTSHSSPATVLWMWHVDSLMNMISRDPPHIHVAYIHPQMRCAYTRASLAYTLIWTWNLMR